VLDHTTIQELLEQQVTIRARRSEYELAHQEQGMDRSAQALLNNN
jgi:hypothetical protein